MESVDITIIGAGVIGLALAQKLASPQTRLLLLEQHSTFGTETSSRHSEVMHAGIYYPKDSLKAKHCVAGHSALVQYCQQYHIPFQLVGKWIVATETNEEAYLEKINQQAQANGVLDLEWISAKQLQQQEPELKATQALLSPSTGIIDSHTFMKSLLAHAENQGALAAFNAEVFRIERQQEGFVVWVNENDPYAIQTRILINSAGLHAQKVASLIPDIPINSIPSLYPCKGTYMSLSGKSPFSKLVYPVPEANTTGLGIHATLDLAGQTRFGPNTEYVSTLDYSVSHTHLPQYYQAIRRYFPSLPEGSLHPNYTGIRPKLQAPGAPACDFMIQDESEHHIPHLIQLFGIESPGLTASLAIADYVGLMVNGEW